MPLEVVSAMVEAVVGCDGASSQPGNVTLITVVAPLLRDLALWRSSVALHTVTMLCSLATHEQELVSGDVGW